MQDTLIDHERKMLVLSYLQAQADGNEDQAAEVRSYAEDDPELGRMLDAEDEESVSRMARIPPVLKFVVSLLDRLAGGRSPV